ncbi:electron transfer flavoprotein subunit alpha/FixB family protein [Adlercreutzia sp. R21]|uniref:electron transfer flavoprotein subunit alpha/FixB family protein n=1 Tax=Adlercreutzia wanghongyangiae TaxID=3111451 RepID=UPI002DBB398B|nr:electron transfer flavoprotein subunit alpha/FixB family protein [Adlercreutzia sp. R21]MEC4184335.1 electron transfer flavoprotein subunit alpha/FixB family protein [Adlercreutzia sp. R21]
MTQIMMFADAPSAYAELAAAARALEAEPVALYAGSRAGADEIAGFGAKVLYFGEIPAGAMAEDVVSAFETAIKREQPALVLAAASKRDALVAGRLAVRLGVPAVNDVSGVTLAGEGAEVTHLVYGGAAARTERVGAGAILLLAAGTFAADGVAGGEVVEEAAAVEAGPVKLTGTEERQEERVDLGAAKCVICVGRGIGSEENVQKALEIAHKLGGEVACTRPIAEGEGWLARSRYLGVSGATVKPQIYIGLGVSGQVQHTVGMNEAAYVVSVNKDKNAPLMKHCDLGVVMDVDTALDVLGRL